MFKKLLGIKNSCETAPFSIKQQLETMSREIDYLCRAISKTQSELNATAVNLSYLVVRISKLDDRIDDAAYKINSHFDWHDNNPPTTPITGAQTKPKRNTRAEPRKRAPSGRK